MAVVTAGNYSVFNTLNRLYSSKESAPPNELNGQTSMSTDDSPFIDGIQTMEMMMATLFAVSRGQLKDISDKLNVSHTAQDYANDVNANAGDMDANGKNGSIDDKIIAYLRDNNIEINGESIDQFLGKTDGNGKLTKAQMLQVKSALEHFANDASGFVQTAQLSIQQIMQSYNIATQMANSLQSMGAEMNKGIASSIR